jgi:hypothetical protein
MIGDRLHPIRTFFCRTLYLSEGREEVFMPVSGYADAGIPHLDSEGNAAFAPFCEKHRSAGSGVTLGYLHCGPPGSPFRQLVQSPETKGFGGAGGHTCRLLSLGNEIHAQVALLHFSVGAKLGHAEGTRHETEMTAEAPFPIHRHDPIFRSLRDGTPGTYCLARGVPAVEAGKGDASVCDRRKGTIPDSHDSPPFDAPFDSMQGLTSHFTGVALHTSVRIEIKAVLFCYHRYLA